VKDHTKYSVAVDREWHQWLTERSKVKQIAADALRAYRAVIERHQAKLEVRA
jgi:hypothetical protein